MNGAGKKILLVDDDKALLKMVRSQLMFNGFEVLTAETGEDALYMVKDHMPDLIVLDVILPGVKGRYVCSKIKEDPTTRNIPVVFLTSKDSPDDVRAEMDAGAAMHLTKPVNPQQLIDVIKTILFR